jgi:amino acid transporter
MPDSSPTSPPPAETQSEGLNWSALIQRVSLVVVIVVVVIFGIGLLLAFSDAPVNAPRVQVIREVLTTILLLLSIIMIVAFTLLILQIIRLVSTVRHETKPILDTTRETLTQAKGSVEFVGKHVSDPIITLSAWVAGLGLLIRDLGGIRRAIQRRETPEEEAPDANPES